MCAPSLTERTDSKKLEISPGLSCRERKHCSCWGRGGSREDAVSRTTPRQTTLQGAETEMHSGHSVLGYLVVCCFLQPYPRVRTLKVDLGDHAGSLCPSSQRGYIDKIPFSAFCYYFGSIHWLSKDIQLDLAC